MWDVVVRVGKDLVGSHEFRLLVAGVDGFIVGAGGGHDLAAIDAEGLEDKGAVAGQIVDAVLPLEDGGRAFGGCYWGSVRVLVSVGGGRSYRLGWSGSTLLRSSHLV